MHSTKLTKNSVFFDTKRDFRLSFIVAELIKVRQIQLYVEMPSQIKHVHFLFYFYIYIYIYIYTHTHTHIFITCIFQGLWQAVGCFCILGKAGYQLASWEVTNWLIPPQTMFQKNLLLKYQTVHDYKNSLSFAFGFDYGMHTWNKNS